MESNKQERLKEKIIMLIETELKSEKFNVSSIEIYFELSPTSPGQLIKIDNYDITLDFDYDGPLDGYDPYSFSNHLRSMCDKARDSVSRYVITSEGKISSDSDNILVSEAMILNIEYKLEELHKFTLGFKIDCEQYD